MKQFIIILLSLYYNLATALASEPDPDTTAAVAASKPLPEGLENNKLRFGNDFYTAPYSKPGLWFVMTPCTGDWYELKGHRNAVFQELARSNVAHSGLLGFTQTLACYEGYYGLPDELLWIVYAVRSEERPTKPVTFREIVENVEMFFSVTFDKDSVFSCHMGITRVQLRTINFPSISLPLHGFAATVTKSMNPKIEYMITTPVGNMREILSKKFRGKISIGISDSSDLSAKITYEDTWITLWKPGLEGERVKLVEFNVIEGKTPEEMARVDDPYFHGSYAWFTRNRAHPIREDGHAKSWWEKDTEYLFTIEIDAMIQIQYDLPLQLQALEDHRLVK